MDIIHVAAIVSAVHLLALALGLPGVVLRGRALRSLRGLRGPRGGAGLGRLFAADTAWGLAAVLWLGSGLLRAFGGLEKGSAFYLASPLFLLKMGLLGAILLLEVWPMATFIRWRVQRARGLTPNTAAAGRLYVVNQLQVGLVVAMVFTASFMARGVGYGG